MLNETTDIELLERAKQGDEAGFVRLYERHRAVIFRFAYRLLGSVEAAEDATHDCFLSLIKNAPRFDASRGVALRTYLYAATRNLALKQLRRQGQQIAVDDSIEKQLPEIVNTHNQLRQLLDDELSEKVREAIQGLPVLQREALILFQYEGLSLIEVATIVEADVNTVKARLYRARARIRSELAPYFQTKFVPVMVARRVEKQ